MVRQLHVYVAYLSVAFFIVRGVWALTGSALRQQKWVRIAPHLIDTVLLALGVYLAWRLAVSPLEGWLAAKLLGLLAYIGFGVLTMRAGSTGLRMLGFSGALITVLYIFAVAFERSAWPF